MSEEKKKLFLLDAFALIYRAYYAFIKNPRVNSSGLNTSAILGFTNTLLDVLKNQNPTHIAVVFDAPGPTDRAVEYTEYKANREAMPEDIRTAIPYIKKIVQGFNIPMMELPGYEADDLIGTLAKQAEKNNFVTYMMTPDKDFGQLVSENIYMFKPARGGNPPEVLGVKEVCEKFEVEDPIQVIDILGLWGDAVDNIPGIPGIGEKTAKKLVGKYGSVEGLIENAEELKGKQKENVINFAEQGLLSKKLATIIVDAPVEFKEEELIMSEPNKDDLIQLFGELEFRTMAKRAFGAEIKTTAPVNAAFQNGASSGQMDLFGPPTDENGEVIEIQNIENTDHSYHFLQTDKEIDDLVTTLTGLKKFLF